MAKLKHISTGDEHILTSTFLVGRAETCALRLDKLLVSSQHAVFHWRGEGWEVRDLGSRNGTFVNRRKLDVREAVLVCKGAEIAFGGMEMSFLLSDDTPPQAIAHSETGVQVKSQEEGFLPLPNAEQPELWVSPDLSGRWVIETRDGAYQPTRNGETIHAGGQSWRLELPTVLEKTVKAEGVAGEPVTEIGLRFMVSRDRKYVEIDVLLGDRCKHFPPRAHHHVLLALARKRLADQTDPALANVPASEHGWIAIDELRRMLGATQSKLDLDIFRARQQFGDEAGLPDARRLIERRRGAQIRLNVSRIEIID